MACIAELQCQLRQSADDSSVAGISVTEDGQDGMYCGTAVLAPSQRRRQLCCWYLSNSEDGQDGMCCGTAVLAPSQRRRQL
jgi:hypothetical protein